VDEDTQDQLTYLGFDLNTLVADAENLANQTNQKNA